MEKHHTILGGVCVCEPCRLWRYQFMETYSRHLKKSQEVPRCQSEEEDLTDEESRIQGIEPELDDTFEPSEEDEDEYIELEGDVDMPPYKRNCLGL